MQMDTERTQISLHLSPDEHAGSTHEAQTQSNGCSALCAYVGLGAEDPDPEAPSLVSFLLSAMHDLLLDPDFGRSQERTTPAVKDMYAVKAAQRKMCIDNLRDLTKGVDI